VHDACDFPESGLVLASRVDLQQFELRFFVVGSLRQHFFQNFLGLHVAAEVEIHIGLGKRVHIGLAARSRRSDRWWRHRGRRHDCRGFFTEFRRDLLASCLVITGLPAAAECGQITTQQRQRPAADGNRRLLADLRLNLPVNWSITAGMRATAAHE